MTIQPNVVVGQAEYKKKMDFKSKPLPLQSTPEFVIAKYQ